MNLTNTKARNRATLARMSKLLAREKGGLLLEALIGRGILLTVLSAAVTSLATGASGVVTCNEVTVAQNIARSQLDFTLNDTYFPAPYSYPTITPPSGYTVTSEAQAYPGSDDNLELIIVTVYRDGQSLLVVEGAKGNR